ncbi:hypothetical protein F4801DRAFT_529595 [Xylaria longipes]|nr:hypothetical protein F4801DRAFT_529595 [Xylaria longipes]
MSSSLQCTGQVASAASPAGDFFVFYYDSYTGYLTVAKTKLAAHETSFHKYMVLGDGGGWIHYSRDRSASAGIAACWWNNEVYLFYVDENKTLRDVQSKDGLSWRGGTLGSRNIKVWNRSSLTAMGQPYPRVIFSENTGSVTQARWESRQWNIETLHTH